MSIISTTSVLRLIRKVLHAVQLDKLSFVRARFETDCTLRKATRSLRRSGLRGHHLTRKLVRSSTYEHVETGVANKRNDLKRFTCLA